MSVTAATAALQEAIATHRAGRIAEAEVAYRKILRDYPDHPDALHFLGLLHFHRRDPDKAVRLISKSLRRAPGNPHAWNNLGNIFVTCDRTGEAQEAYRRVIELEPTMAEAWYNLGVCLRDSGEFEKAAQNLRGAIRCQPDFFRAYETLAMLCYRLGWMQEASEIYSEWSCREPSNAKARHMAAATSGHNVPARASDDYVQLLFDKFAAAFDFNLRQLGYRAPEIVAAALVEYVAERAEPLEVLDAGCGTGLCGPLIRAHCRRLVGVDLSPKMIERATERGGYDELVAGELCAYMNSQPLAFDAVISADTLVYFGALEEVMAGFARSLRPRGILIVTVEALVESGQDYLLESHGRYVHHEAYLRRVCSAANLEVVRLVPETLRQERLQDVKGYLLIARRSSGAQIA